MEKKTQTKQTKKTSHTQPNLFLIWIVSGVAKFPLSNLWYNFKQSDFYESVELDIDHCFGIIWQDIRN